MMALAGKSSVATDLAKIEATTNKRYLKAQIDLSEGTIADIETQLAHPPRVQDLDEWEHRARLALSHHRKAKAAAAMRLAEIEDSDPLARLKTEWNECTERQQQKFLDWLEKKGELE